MSKSLLYRWFGAGGIPEALRRQLEAEGLIFLEEGLRARTRYRRYKAPGQRFSGIKGNPGWVALTRERLVAKNYSSTTTDLPVAELAHKDFECGVRGRRVFWFGYDAADFYPDRSGRCEHRFTTDRAQLYLEHLRAAMR